MFKGKNIDNGRVSRVFGGPPLPSLGFSRVFGGPPEAPVWAGYFRWNSQKSLES